MNVTLHIVADDKHIKHEVDNYRKNMTDSELNSCLFFATGDFKYNNNYFKFMVYTKYMMDKIKGLHIKTLVIDDRVNISRDDYNYLLSRIR